MIRTEASVDMNSLLTPPPDMTSKISLLSAAKMSQEAAQIEPRLLRLLLHVNLYEKLRLQHKQRLFCPSTREAARSATAKGIAVKQAVCIAYEERELDIDELEEEDEPRANAKDSIAEGEGTLWDDRDLESDTVGLCGLMRSCSVGQKQEDHSLRWTAPDYYTSGDPLRGFDLSRASDSSPRRQICCAPGQQRKFVDFSGDDEPILSEKRSVMTKREEQCICRNF